eukprot:263349_1
MAQSDVKSVITSIDIALHRYYKRFYQNDYINSDGKGKFLAFCEDNDLDTDAVLEEFGTDADDCTLCDMDDNFPLKDDQKQDRNQTIYNIIKGCYDNPDVYAGDAIYDVIEIKKEHFTLLPVEETQNISNDENKDETLQAMSYNKLKTMAKPLIDQCYAVMCKGEQDQTFLQLLYIGQEKLNGKPYIHLVSDLYARDRINHYLQIKPLIKKEFDD